MQSILGFLNYSTGQRDPKFFASWNTFWKERKLHKLGAGDWASHRDSRPWRRVIEPLEEHLDELTGEEPFHDTDQARRVLRLLGEEFLPAYFEFHRDLLGHWSYDQACQPFFLARCCEVLLAALAEQQDPEQVIPAALKRANDYVGYRPVAVLESKRKLEPYEHEFVCPVPVYVKDAGVAFGPYQAVIEEAMKILRKTPQGILDEAHFDLELLDELAVDPRAYDFSHPVHRRPNYQFGTWDFRRIDENGYYRRYVLQSTILDCIMRRVDTPGEIPKRERAYEAAAVLAGTMLMGSGMSGNRPDTHPSDTHLGKLLQRIAAYRDMFYEGLLQKKGGKHGERLRAERIRLAQAFGAARQGLNHEISRLRARQEIRARVALLYADMGRCDAAAEEVLRIDVASARVRAAIESELITADHAVKEGRFNDAAEALKRAEDFLHRGIQCGALADPWNILGFGGNFDLFVSRQDATRDDRIDILIQLVYRLLSVYGNAWKEAVASGHGDIAEWLKDQSCRVAEWWDQYGSATVSDIDGFYGMEMWEAIQRASRVLRQWREAGTERGDIAFWRQHVDNFMSSDDYAIIVETLLNHGDLVATMGLLVHWVSRAEEVTLGGGLRAFQIYCVRWLAALWQAEQSPAGTASQRWEMTRKFVDYLEANAGEYWSVPRMSSDVPTEERRRKPPQDEEPEDEDDIFRAAFEGMLYRDSTDDGFEGEVADDSHNPLVQELNEELERISDRLLFLITIAHIWHRTAVAVSRINQLDVQRQEMLLQWRKQADRFTEQLLDLADAVFHYRIPDPRGDLESIIDYDQARSTRDMLCERVLETAVEMSAAARVLAAAVPEESQPESDDGEGWQSIYRTVLRAFLLDDAETAGDYWQDLLDRVVAEPILYVHLARGGDPREFFAAQNLQHALGRLVRHAPRLGLIHETLQLLHTVRLMEEGAPAAAAAVTEYDRLYEYACESILLTLLETFRREEHSKRKGIDRIEKLFDMLKVAVERLLEIWLKHSRNIRVSSVEPLNDPEIWSRVKGFIRRYGGELFSQEFMAMQNLRGILHEGVGNYLRSLEEEPYASPVCTSLLEDLASGKLKHRDADACLQLIIEGILENYPEYIDYNGITTQSDYGQNLYMLLEFLRLVAGYYRTLWNLKPVLKTHEILVGEGEYAMADAWELAVKDRTDMIAEELFRQYERLSNEYAIHLPSVYDRLQEQFVQPLLVTRMLELARRVMKADEEEAERAFDELREYVDQLINNVSGFHYHMAEWLEALGDTVERIRDGVSDLEETWEATLFPVKAEKVTARELLRQIEAWRE